VGREHLKFGGGVAGTILNPFVLVVVLIAGVLICVWPRSRVIVPFLAASILIPMDQVLLIGPAHFPMLRVLVLFGIIRMVQEKMTSKVRLFSGGINKIDIAVILLTICVAVNGVLLFPESGAFINQLGSLFTVFGIYFLLRFLIRNEADVVRAIQTLAWIAAFIAVVMFYEVRTGHNPYAMLGGAGARFIESLAVREGKVRAQGPFAHSILAGTFGAVLVPLFVGLWWKGRKYRTLAVVGIVSSTVIAIACNSSTPVLAYAAGVLALCFWGFRQRMRVVRWGVVLTLIALHLVMKGPVWSLIEKIDISGGSSSWHRFMLIDQCIRHFGDWWLFGIKDTSIWGWDMWDTANQYVSVCENSGLLPFILFVAVLVYGFKYLGRARRVVSSQKDKKTALFLWALGSALFANVIAFIGISYFDQTEVGWYALLAMIPAAIAVRPKKESKPEPITAPTEETSLVSQLAEEAAGMGAERYSTS
jgi:hypothetical protein